MRKKITGKILLLVIAFILAVMTLPACTTEETIEEREKCAFIVEHDLMVAHLLADEVIIFRGIPGFKGQTLKQMFLNEGINLFLKEMGITFRKDPETGRPRANKIGSRIDRFQKEAGKYYYGKD